MSIFQFRFCRLPANTLYECTKFHHKYLLFVTLPELHFIIIPFFTLDLISETFKYVDILLMLLDHLHPLSPHLQDCAVHIQLLLPSVQEENGKALVWVLSSNIPVQILQNQFVHSNEGPGPAHPRAAVHHHRLGHLGLLPGHLDQVPQYLGVLGGGEVSPLLGL